MAYLVKLRDYLPVDCVLCRTRARGGLCAHCRGAVCASMNEHSPRCGRCALPLCIEVSDTVNMTHTAKAGDAAVPPQPQEDAAFCPDCLALRPAFDGIGAAFDYEWPGDLLVHQLKQQGRLSCAPVLAGMLAQCVLERKWYRRSLWVVPVPASRHALIARGYNPAAEVGRQLARRLGMAWRPAVLWRARQGSNQKALNRRERRESVEGLYRASPEVAGQEVLIIDDVMTTGSTLSAIAGELKRQGALSVWGAVVARTPMTASRM